MFYLVAKRADLVDVVSGERGPASDINLASVVFDPDQIFAGDKAYIGEPQIKTTEKTGINS